MKNQKEKLEIMNKPLINLEEHFSDHEDYALAFTKMQKLTRELNRQLSSKKYVDARNTSREIALYAMQVGVWCNQFIEKNNHGS